MTIQEVEKIIDENLGVWERTEYLGARAYLNKSLQVYMDPEVAEKIMDGLHTVRHVFEGVECHLKRTPDCGVKAAKRSIDLYCNTGAIKVLEAAKEKGKLDEAAERVWKTVLEFRVEDDVRAAMGELEREYR